MPRPPSAFDLLENFLRRFLILMVIDDNRGAGLS